MDQTEMLEKIIQLTQALEQEKMKNCKLNQEAEELVKYLEEKKKNEQNLAKLQRTLQQLLEENENLKSNNEMLLKYQKNLEIAEKKIKTLESVCDRLPSYSDIDKVNEKLKSLKGATFPYTLSSYISWITIIFIALGFVYNSFAISDLKDTTNRIKSDVEYSIGCITNVKKFNNDGKLYRYSVFAGTQNSIYEVQKRIKE